MPTPKPKSIVTLPPETRQKLADMAVDLVSARKAIQTLKTLNMDTVDMESKLEWAEQVRKTLLSEFS